MHPIPPLFSALVAPPRLSCGPVPWRRLGMSIALLTLTALAAPAMASSVGPLPAELAGSGLVETAWSEPHHEHQAAEQLTLDEVLDEVDLLDPNLSPEVVLELLADLLGDDPAGQAKGGATATGYTAHRKWGVGGADGYGLDQFGGASSGTYRARAAVRLDNGHVVVVGDIQGSGVSAVRNLGMVKFNAQGRRVIWTSVPKDFSQAGGNYIKFPGTNVWGLDREVFSVHDVKVFGSFLYVLITFNDDGVRRPAIIRWGVNGSGYSWWFANPPDGSGNVRDAVAMDLLGDRLIVLARRSSSTIIADGGFWTTRWTINGDGSLTLGERTAFLTGERRVPADIAFERRSFGVIQPISPAYYVTYTFNNGTTSTSQHRPCIAKIRGDNTLDPDFGFGGLDCVPFANGGNNVDRAVALQTRFIGTFLNPSEAMYLAVDVDRNLARGVGLVKFIDGVPAASFGPGGRRLYGGCASTNPSVGEGCSGLFPIIQHTSHTPLRGALFANASGVYVAGHTFRSPGTNQTVPTRRPIFLHVNDSNGALQSLQAFGTYPNSQFAALVPKPGSTEFTVVGFASDEDTASINTGPKRFLTAHLVRNSDLIFYDGLE